MGAGASTSTGGPNAYQALSLVFGDLASNQFASDLKKNPADYVQFLNTQVDKLVDESYNRKRTTFQKAQIDLGRYMDMEHNSNFYKARSGDVDRLTDAIGANNRRIQQELARDKDISRRQFEINDWFNYNKLETLFFLQLFFMGALAMAVIIFLTKNNTLTPQLSSLISLILIGVVIGTGMYRWYYTRQWRDNRLWHRRHFPKEDAPPKAPTCSASGEAVITVGNQCTAEIGQKVNNLMGEMANFQDNGVAPNSANLGGSICSSLNQKTA